MTRPKFSPNFDIATVLTISSVIVSAVVLWVHSDDKISANFQEISRLDRSVMSVTDTVVQLKAAVAMLTTQDKRIDATERRIEQLEAARSRN